MISKFWMKIENTECFEDVKIYTVDVQVKEHKRPEVIEKPKIKRLRI